MHVIGARMCIMHHYACIIILRVRVIPFAAFDVAVKPSGRAIRQMTVLWSLHLNLALVEEHRPPILFSMLWSSSLSHSLPAPAMRSGISGCNRSPYTVKVKQRTDL